MNDEVISQKARAILRKEYAIIQMMVWDPNDEEAIKIFNKIKELRDAIYPQSLSLPKEDD